MASISLNSRSANQFSRRSTPEVLKRLSALIISLSVCAGLVVTCPSLARADEKNYTAEQIVESSILIYGTRPGLTQVRRNGDERGKVVRITGDGRTEEATYEKRFIRGESIEKDKVRLDQKTPTIEYALVTDDGRTWGIINGASFTPRQDAAAQFLSEIYHNIDALLRYKENGSTLALIGKDKKQNLDLYVVNLTDKANRQTKYYISAKTARVLWLEYEETPPTGGTPVKYMRRFYDYRYAQGTLVPFRTVLFEDGKQSQETHVSTITYGVKLDEALFKNPDGQQASATP
jgi:hypothetical protein